MDGNYGNNNYNSNNYNSGNYNGYNYNGNMQWQNPAPQQAPVRDVFCNLLLVIFLLQIVNTVVMMHSMLSAMTYRSLLDGSYIYEMYSGAYMICSLLNFLFLIAMIVFFVLDIVAVNKAHHKILGLVLFAILFRPGYYIWRAYILERKKTFPIIYTVVYCAALLGYILYIIVKMMQMISSVAAMY